MENKEFNLDIYEIADEKDKRWLKYLKKIEEEHKEEISKLNKKWIKRMANTENVYRQHLGLPELRGQ